MSCPLRTSMLLPFRKTRCGSEHKFVSQRPPLCSAMWQCCGAIPKPCTAGVGLITSTHQSTIVVHGHGTGHSRVLRFVGHRKPGGFTTAEASRDQVKRRNSPGSAGAELSHLGIVFVVSHNGPLRVMCFSGLG